MLSSCAATSPLTVGSRRPPPKRPSPCWRMRAVLLTRSTGRPFIPRSTTTSKAPRRGEVWLARLDNVRPIVLVARARLVRRVGRARPAIMNAICTALSTAVGCGYSYPSSWLGSLAHFPPPERERQGEGFFFSCRTCGGGQGWGGGQRGGLKQPEQAQLHLGAAGMASQRSGDLVSGEFFHEHSERAPGSPLLLTTVGPLRCA